MVEGLSLSPAVKWPLQVKAEEDKSDGGTRPGVISRRNKIRMPGGLIAVRLASCHWVGYLKCPPRTGSAIDGT